NRICIKINLKSYSLGYWYRKYNTGFNGFIQAVETLNNNSNSISSTIDKTKITFTGYYNEELLLKIIRTGKKI
ncbi:MAG: hypothetical protein WC006_09535, partial [Bacilli bacterium]